MDQDTDIKIKFDNKRKRKAYGSLAKRLRRPMDRSNNETLNLSPDNQLQITINTAQTGASGSKRTVKLQSTPEQEKKEDIEMQSNEIIEIKSENEEKSYAFLIFKCFFCPETLDTIELRKEHCLRHYSFRNPSEIVCNICHKSVPSLEEHLELHNCKTCDITFLKTEDCRTHLQTHSYCFRCDEQFTSRKSFNDHWIEVHSKSFFNCNVCRLQFNRNENLKIHYRLNHPEQEAILTKECFICKESFDEDGDYKKHFLIHLPLKCNICQVKFEYDYMLVRHMSKTHPFECCGRTFAKKKQYDIHFQRHFKLNPYICEICNAGFNRNMDLFTHKHCHKFKEIRYKCQTRFYLV